MRYGSEARCVMKRMARISIGLVTILLLAASIAMPTQVLRMSPPELGAAASRVVLGKVSGVSSFTNACGTKVFTEIVVEADTTYKGEHLPVVRLVQLGGTIGNLRVTVSGAPQWQLDEEMLLFLEPYDESKFHVVGFAQGKFAVMRHERTRKAYVRYPSMEGIQVLGAPGQADTDSRARARGMALGDFIDYALEE